jgi:hypothetical protein
MALDSAAAAVVMWGDSAAVAISEDLAGVVISADSAAAVTSGDSAAVVLPAVVSGAEVLLLVLRAAGLVAMPFLDAALDAILAAGALAENFTGGRLTVSAPAGMDTTMMTRATRGHRTATRRFADMTITTDVPSDLAAVVGKWRPVRDDTHLIERLASGPSSRKRCCASAILSLTSCRER